MCWKSHVQDPQPRPTAMAIVVSTAEDSQIIANVTQGGSACPDEATACSNITSSLKECHNGLCCEHNGQQLCSCFPGWLEPDCDVQDFDTFQSLSLASSTKHWLIGVIIAVLLVGLLIIVFFIYRKKRCQEKRNQDPEGKQLASVLQSEELLSSATTTKTQVNENAKTSEPRALLQKEQNTNGNDKGAS